jgi:hypothetical protein
MSRTRRLRKGWVSPFGTKGEFEILSRLNTLKAEMVRAGVTNRRLAEFLQERKCAATEHDVTLILTGRKAPTKAVAHLIGEFLGMSDAEGLRSLGLGNFMEEEDGLHESGQFDRESITA